MNIDFLGRDGFKLKLERKRSMGLDYKFDARLSESMTEMITWRSLLFFSSLNIRPDDWKMDRVCLV